MVLVAPGERHDYHQAPMRLNVTGNAGAGKTSLSKRLGAALGLPVMPNRWGDSTSYRRRHSRGL